MQVTFNQVVKAFKDIATAHHQIHSFGFGDPWEVATSGTIHYPQMFVIPQPSTVQGGVVLLRFSMLIMDLVHKGEGNENEVLSDTLLIATDVISLLKGAQYSFNIDESSTSLEDFTERFDDEVSGWRADITLRIPFTRDRCAVPSDVIATGTPRCPVVTIKDSNGNVVTTVDAGNAYVIPSTSCSPVTVRDQDNNTVTTVAAGGTYNVIVFSGINDSGDTYTNSIIDA